MNYQELKKLATPGPWVVEGGQDKRTSVDVTLTARTPIYRNPRYVGRVYGQGALTNDCAERDANAALIAHCVNNFDKALELLKEVAVTLCDDQRDIDWINREIAELETVED